MNSLQQRQTLLPLIEEACTAGARLHKACGQLGLSVRSVQRWRMPGAEQGDRRVAELRKATTPANKLSPAERQAALEALNPVCQPSTGQPVQ
jgi:putative transposase